jgi:hypothetical protein
MKKRTLPGCLLMAALPSLLFAQEEASDSLHRELQEVEIMSIRATSTTPVAYTDIGSEELKRSNTGVDFPFLVSMTPSAVATSDAGAGIGYTSLRIRGTDATRISSNFHRSAEESTTMRTSFKFIIKLLSRPKAHAFRHYMFIIPFINNFSKSQFCPICHS